MELKDGVPCEHPGCANHVTHPCEGCGRIGASSKLTAVRIAELEAQLEAMQQIIDGYKDDLKIPENVLGVLKLSYRKHHLLDDSVGSTELSDFLMDTICELIGNDGFQEWLDELECCNIVVE